MDLVFPSWALVKRELLSSLRGARAFLFLVAFTGAAMLFVYAQWPGKFSAESLGFSAAGQVSRSMMETFARGLLYGSILFVPAYAASALVLERERETYDFLTMSMIRPGGILFGKLLNALGFFFLLLISLMPVLAVSFFLIGIDPLEYAGAMLYVITTAFSCAAVGLLASARFRRTFAAIGASYVGVLLFLTGPVIITYISAAGMYFIVNIRAVRGYVSEAALVTFPPGTMEGILSGTLSRQIFATAVFYEITLSLICLFLTLRILRRPLKPPKIENVKPIDDEAELDRRRKTFPFYLVDPLRRKKPIEDGRNPMMVREMRWGLLNRGTAMIRVFYSAFVIYFFIGIVASTGMSTFNSMVEWLMVQIAVTLLTCPALMANAFTKEHELGNLDMLRMTLLRPKDVVLGKLFAGMLSISPVVVAAILSCVPVILLGVRHWGILFMGYVTLLVCALMSLGLGLFASLLTRRTSTALALSYVFNIVFFGGGIILVAWLQSIGGQVFGSTHASILSPILSFEHSTQGRAADAWNLDYGHWMSSITMTLAIGLAFVGASVYGFSRYRMQDR